MIHHIIFKGFPTCDDYSLRVLAKEFIAIKKNIPPRQSGVKTPDAFGNVLF